MKLHRSWLAAATVIGVFTVAGCASETSQQTGEGAAERAGKAVDAAGAEVKQETKEAGQAIEKGAQDVAQGAENAAAAVGAEVKDEVRDAEKGLANAGKEAEKAVAGAGKAIDAAGDKVELTTKVRQAIVGLDGVSIPDLNVDTVAETKTVVIKGTAPSAAAKAKVSDAAKKALGDDKDYKIDNQLKATS